MDLDERKWKILNIIIENYMDTGEPVGSRTISKAPGLNVSSATVRNEMADLEEMGYIIQPHTSAGRIPTDRGYRLYVDRMLQEKLKELEAREEDVAAKEREVEEQNELLLEKVDKVERLLHHVAVLLADHTNYTTMVTAPAVKANRIKFLQLSQIDRTKLILVCVLDANVIKNQIIDVDQEIHPEIMFKLNMILNTNLNGEVVDDISISQIMRIKEQAGEQADLIMQVVEALGRTLVEDDGLEIYTGGTTNILKYPELSDAENIGEILTELVEKQELAEFMADRPEDETGIQVYIGKENRVEGLSDCSIVTMNYELKDGLMSTIGIIGPKRMDYRKVIENLDEVKEQLDRIFGKDPGS